MGPTDPDPCNLEPCSACGTPIVSTWLGTVDEDWNNPANWSEGIIPTPCHEVMINSGTVTIKDGADAECLSINIEQGALLDEEVGCTLTVMECGMN